MLDPNDLPYRRNVGVMLYNPDGLVLVARRIDTPTAWQMPQGGIDGDEDPVAAGLRELGEEIGTQAAEIVAETTDWLHYDLPPALRGQVWGGKYRGQTQKWLLARFTGSDTDIDLAGPHPEFDAWRWVPPEDTVALIVDFKQPIYRRVITQFAPLIPRRRPAAP
ncbi:MAG: RNA pyrophosphohydrolase [Azospirillaceae bacterium]|nr:RNA pyrophosphohydrolase [Azospirillaceae bacterium]